MDPKADIRVWFEDETEDFEYAYNRSIERKGENLPKINCCKKHRQCKIYNFFLTNLSNRNRKHSLLFILI